jgi:hypothetical protein
VKKELAFSVGIHDCRVDTFRAGGKGGQNQNKRDTGVRVVHEASGAVGESREERSQLQNKKNAFRRMALTPKFQAWCKLQCLRTSAVKWDVEQELQPERLKVEMQVDGQWAPFAVGAGNETM